MKKWSSLLMIAIFALLTPLLSPNVSAEEVPGISITKIADRTSAAVGDTIIYTYTIINAGSIVTDNITLNDDMLGPIALDTTTLAPSENVTATADYTVLETDLPGPLKNTAKITARVSAFISFSHFQKPFFTCGDKF